MGYFPFFIDIENKNCLIVGGGEVALRKIKKLIPYRPDIYVVAKSICEEISNINYPRLFIHKREFLDEDIKNQFFVIAATDDFSLNHRIAELCRSKKLLVNVVDSKDDCGFIFPSLFKRGNLSVGISSSGISPDLSVYYRNILEKNTPSDIENILDFMEDARVVAKQRIPDIKRRKIFLKECLSKCLSINGIPEQKHIEKLIEKHTGTGRENTGFVHIVGAGCSDADLITVRGLNCVQNADVVIYDDLISEDLLDITKESCEKIYVGKRGGHDYIQQENINRIIVEKALEGNTVVRLKGGDPFVFGRGGEEADSIIENNIPFDVIPGITSAIAIPSEVGIPVTHRGFSRSFHVITGHTSENEISEDIKTLAKLSGTLIFLMGLSNLDDICRLLIKYGKSENTPSAVISGGNSKNKITIRSSLKNLPEECSKNNVKSPVVIVIGKVAELNFINQESFR